MLWELIHIQDSELMKASYLLSPKFPFAEHAAFALSATLVIGGSEGYFRPGKVLIHMTDLITKGITFDSQQYTELGKWGNRSDNINSIEEISDECYFAWVDQNFWNYEPSLKIYTKPQFMILFEDCCRNFMALNPDRADEFAQALSVNGMSLLAKPEKAWRYLSSKNWG